MSDSFEEGPADFQSISHLDEMGEYWFARELASLFGYGDWNEFCDAIDRGRLACAHSGHTPEHHFIKLHFESDDREHPFGIVDYRLTRYACYLIVQNSDPAKHSVALAQTFFAVKAHQQEIEEKIKLSAFSKLSEDDKRLKLHGEYATQSIALFVAANSSGVRTSDDYEEFTDEGIRGLYGGLRLKDLKTRKRLDARTPVEDQMGSAELAANFFRITQTEERLKNDGVCDKRAANRVHLEVGRNVRATMRSSGGTLPEDLATPKRNISELKAQRGQPRPLGDEFGFVPVRHQHHEAQCPHCREQSLRVGLNPCTCANCDREWISSQAAALLTERGPYTCPGCQEFSVAFTPDKVICCNCGLVVDESHLKCGVCSAPVPLSQWSTFEEEGHCHLCASDIADRTDD